MSNSINIYPWGNNRRINAASNYLKARFGTRIQKLTIDAGFTCPNRDGTIGKGGCAYCNNDAFNPTYCDPAKSVTVQMEQGMQFHAKRYRNAPEFFAYFQAYSNTYAPLEKLRELYSEALANERVVGLIIGTRPDCIDEPILEYLSDLSEKYYVVVEYGLESVYDKTLTHINRGHSFEDSVKALELTASFGVMAGAHIIFGLPGESRSEMMESVDVLSKLPLHSVKFHQLQIVKGTRFEKDYVTNPKQFELFDLEEYIQFICTYLNRLNPDFIVERLAGETQPGNCISDRWGLRYDQVLRRIEDSMEAQDLWQGKFYNID